MFIGRIDVEAKTRKKKKKNKIKLEYFGHLMQRADSFEKTLVLGKI